MKTNIIMNSEDRKIFGITIRQETKTGFLNLSDLQEAYLHARVKNGWSDKRIDHILTYNDNIYRIYYILFEQQIINVSLDTFIENVENVGFLKYLKKLEVYKTTGARQNKTTWCNSYIWVLVAMELSPAIYGKVVVWLADKLITNRIEAGNFYKDLSRAISKFENADYIKMAKALNYKIFGRHETGIRNLATKEQLEKMFELERYIAKAIDMGHLKTFDDCIVEVEKY
jgi:hypothetical protein